MPQFSDLSPTSNSRNEFWSSQFSFIQNILTEVNKDVLKGRGLFIQNLSEPRKLLLPNLCLQVTQFPNYPHLEEGEIVIGVSPSGKTLRVYVIAGGNEYNEDYNFYYQDAQVNELVSEVRTAITWWLDKGLALYLQREDLRLRYFDLKLVVNGEEKTIGEIVGKIWDIVPVSPDKKKLEPVKVKLQEDVLETLKNMEKEGYTFLSYKV
jgi:hypothetical protein